MKYLHYLNGELALEQTLISKVVAQYGTPIFIYSRAAIENNWQDFAKAFKGTDTKICYAVKANSNLAILNLFVQQDAGFDIVSNGELQRVLAAGGKAKNIIFSGVGKSAEEISTALQAGIYCFNVESQAELQRISDQAVKLNIQAAIAIRVNPDINTETHPYIATGLLESKFGIPIDDAAELYEFAAQLPQIKPIGIAAHIGSQILNLEPFVDTLDRLLELANNLKNKGINLQHIDMGGGLGVGYQNESVPSVSDYALALLKILKGQPYKLILAPGRSVVADAGILVTKIEYLKHQPTKNFAVVDAAMNDLLRPALYNAWHGIIPIKVRTEGELMPYDIVGPVCENSDFLGKIRHLRVQEGDLLAVCMVGAYGFVMSSNYNSRPRPPEVLIDKDKVHLIRKRETIPDLFANEVVRL